MVFQLIARHLEEVVCAVAEHDEHEHEDEHGEEHEHEAGHFDMMGLRIAAVFIILVGSTFGALFPILARRSKVLHIPKSVFDFAKYFGSGIIIATSFIHLLSPALANLRSDCLAEPWREYPYGLAICMVSIFSLFIVELVAFRWGTAKLARIGKAHDPHGHGQELVAHSAHGPEIIPENKESKLKETGSDVESANSHSDHGIKAGESPLAQIIGVAILEFGVVLHSVLIGLTLAVADEFKVLFIVLVFHQTFEGIGIGARLAYMDIGPKYRWVPYAGAALYGLTTPLGIAAGLGARSSYNPGTNIAIIISGVLYSVSAGILLYTGLVELLAHDFLFSQEMMTASNRKLSLAIFAMCLGALLMSLLGKWV